MTQNDYTSDAVRLLEELISTPSVSRDETRAADLLAQRMGEYGLSYERKGNNIWSIGLGFDERRETLLLNAHIDTVRPTASWERDPYTATHEGDRLYGLGSNDCGGGLVSLLQVLRIYNEQAKQSAAAQKYNLVYLASAEEEVSGQNGICQALPLLPRIDVAIVGEPTGMQPAVAEKGLMVVDLTSHGRSGHAARNEGVNAIYALLDDLQWLRHYRFERVSELLGPTLMQVTMIEAGTQHNVVPDQCKAVVDIRTNELYTNEEVLQFLKENLHCEVKARSTRLSSSSIAKEHPLIRKLIAMGKTPFGSPTLSDQALMPFPSLKMGPGDSSRSHTADEYICISEINDAIATYCQLLL